MNEEHDDGNLAVYKRHKEDTLALDVALLKEQLQDMRQAQEATSKILDTFLKDKIEAKGRADFINKVLAPIGTLVLTILGAFLGYAIPNYMNKH